MKKLIAVLLVSLFAITACDDSKQRDDYHPYVVVEVGEHVTLKYVGPEDMIPKESYVITEGMYDRKRCNLRTTKVSSKGKNHCRNASELVLGNVVRLTSGYIEGGYYHSSYIDCIRCGTVDAEKLVNAAKAAYTSEDQLMLADRVDGLEVAIVAVDEKVYSNMGKIVAAVKTVNTKIEETRDGVNILADQLDSDIAQNKQAINNLKNKDRDIPVAGGIDERRLGQPKGKTITITDKSDENPFNFLEQ